MRYMRTMKKGDPQRVAFLLSHKHQSIHLSKHDDMVYVNAATLARAAEAHFTSGRTSTLRKKISAASVWSWILPSVWLDLLPALTTWPLRIVVM